MEADIITIGDEILIGQVINTNAAYLGEILTRTGFAIRKVVAIPDRASSIIDTLDESIKNSDFVLITGGLGPTNDDITKSTLNKYFGGKLVIHEPSLKMISGFFKSRGYELTERNRQQAVIPDVCEVLINEQGTAPGMLFKEKNKLIVSLPGVPFEMKGLMEQIVIPRIKEHYALPFRMHKTVLTIGLSESYTADKIKEWEEGLGEDCSLAYLPSPGRLRIRISISGANKDIVNRNLNIKTQELVNLLGQEHVYGFDQQTIEEVVGEKLIDCNLSLAVAESCTGGNIAHMITSAPGASAYFKGSVTAYSNEIKEKILHVDQETISRYGAVSKNVVELMAKGVQDAMNANFSIATSGIAGPEGGTPDKPVGTIWIAVASPEKIISRKYLFGDKRERNIVRSSLTALNMLRNILNEYCENCR